ncbi:(4Fe-4S)-binding protein [Haladaptatus sp. W1]|uniref:(4Fe-4S)-binding protein n=1 Tax=Haladaptatus sp. W1 TaxID=1897478 RepID=UPI001586ABFE
MEELPGEFDPSQRPWIDVDNADADEVALVIERCPTGALHYEQTKMAFLNAFFPEI